MHQLGMGTTGLGLLMGAGYVLLRDQASTRGFASVTGLLWSWGGDSDWPIAVLGWQITLRVFIY
jgi:hypothetical protein